MNADQFLFLLFPYMVSAESRIVRLPSGFTPCLSSEYDGILFRKFCLKYRYTRGISDLVYHPCNGAVSHGAKIGSLRVFADHIRKNKSKTNSSTIFASRAAFCMCLSSLTLRRQQMQVTYGYFDYGKPRDPQFEPHGGETMVQVLGSPLYICGLRESAETAKQSDSGSRWCTLGQLDRMDDRLLDPRIRVGTGSSTRRVGDRAGNHSWRGHREATSHFVNWDTFSCILGIIAIGLRAYATRSISPLSMHPLGVRTPRVMCRKLVIRGRGKEKVYMRTVDPLEHRTGDCRMKVPRHRRSSHLQKECEYWCHPQRGHPSERCPLLGCGKQST